MDNLLRDKFLSFEGDIPMSDWSAIEKKLDNKRRIAWIWWAALPLLIVAGLGLYSILKSPSTENLTRSHTTKNKTQNSERGIEKDKIIDNSNPIIDNSNSGPETETGNNKKTNTNTNPNSITPDNAPVVNADDITTPVIETEIPINNFEPVNLESKHVKDLYTFILLPQPQMASDLMLKKPEVKKPSKISFELGVNLSPAAGLDAIKKNSSKSNFIHKDYFSSIAGKSSSANGFNTGIHAQMNLGKHWYIRQGIYSSSYSVYHDYNHTIYSFPYVDETRGIFNYGPMFPETVKYSGKSTIKYISLPLMVGNRTYFTKNIGLETKAAITLSRLTSSTGKTINPTYLTLETIDSNNTIKKWNSGLTISTGLFYKTNNNLIFTVEPYFSTLLGSANTKDYPVKSRYYNYGININVNYILKRK